VIGVLLPPDFPAKPTRGCQNSVVGSGTAALVLPWLGVLASKDNRLPPRFAIAS